MESSGKCDLGERLVAHVLGEGLVEPDVVPPGQGDEVAEPHVGHLVGDDHGAGLPLGVGDGGAVDELVAEGDESGVLHGARVELGDEGLVVGVERVGLVELLVVAVVQGAGDVEDLVGVGVQVRGEGAAAVDAEGQSGVLGGDRVPGSCGDRDEIGGDEGRGGDGPAPLPACSATPLPRTVQPSGAVTSMEKTDLRSGWSKAAKTRWTSSMNNWV